MSLPTMLFGTLDFLAIQEFNDVDDNLDFLLSMPSSSMLTEYNESVTQVKYNEFVNSSLEIFVALAAELNSSIGNLTLGTQCIFIGFGNRNELNADLLTLESGFAQRMVLNECVDIQFSNEAKNVTRTIPIMTNFSISKNEMNILDAICESIGYEPSETQIQLFGEIGTVHDLAITLLPQLDISVLYNSRMAVWGKLQSGIVTGSQNEIVSKLQSILSEIQGYFRNIGDATVLWSPLNNIYEIQSIFSQLQYSLLLISFPSMVAALIFTISMNWISMNQSENERKIFRIRGTPRKLIQYSIIFNGIVVGLVAGILGPVISLIMSVFVYSIDFSHMLDWIAFFSLNSFSIFLLTIIISVIISTLANALTILIQARNISPEREGYRYSVIFFVSLGVLLDAIFSFPALKFIQQVLASSNSNTLQFAFFIISIVEFGLIISSPFLIPIGLAKTFPRWVSILRNIFVSTVHIPELTLKSFSASSATTTKLVLLSITIAFLLSPPLIINETNQKMHSIDEELKMGCQIKAEIYGMNTSDVRSSLRASLLSLPNVTSVVWGMKTQVIMKSGIDEQQVEMIIVDSEYSNLGFVRDYQISFSEGILYSASMLSEVSMSDSVAVEIAEATRQTSIIGSFEFLPGFQSTTFEFQQDIPYLAASSSYIDTVYENPILDGVSMLFIETAHFDEIENTYQQAEGKIRDFISGIGAQFVLERISTDISKKTIQSRFTYTSGMYLILIGMISIVLLVDLSTSETRNASIILRYRGASKKQLVVSSMLENIAVFGLPLIIGFIVSLIFVYGLTILPNLLLYTNRILPLGYHLVIPSVIYLSYILMMCVVLSFTYHRSGKSSTMSSQKFEVASSLAHIDLE